MAELVGVTGRQAVFENALAALHERRALGEAHRQARGRVLGVARDEVHIALHRDVQHGPVGDFLLAGKANDHAHRLQQAAQHRRDREVHAPVELLGQSAARGLIVREGAAHPRKAPRARMIVERRIDARVPELIAHSRQNGRARQRDFAHAAAGEQRDMAQPFRQREAARYVLHNVRVDRQLALYGRILRHTDQRAHIVGRPRGAAVEHDAAARVQRLEKRRLGGRVGVRHGRNEYSARPERLVRLDEQIVRDHRVERQPLIDGVLDQPVVHEYILHTARIEAEAHIALERIEPRDKAGRVGIVAVRIQQMRRDLDGAAAGQLAVGIVGGEEADALGRRDAAVFVQPRDAQRQINIVRRAVIAVEPRAVVPPRVVRIISEEIALFGQMRHARHETGQLQPEAEIERSPRRIGRRDQRLDAANVVDRAAVRGNVHAGGEVAAARLDARVARNGGELAPERADILAYGGGVCVVKALAVEQLALPVPRLQREAEAVAQPDVVEAHVAPERHELLAQKAAEMRALGNAVGIGGVAIMVGVQPRGAVYPQTVHQAAAVHLGMAVEFEVGIGELGAGIERFAHLDVQLQHFAPDPLECGNNALQVAIAHDGRVVHVEIRPMVDFVAVRIACGQLLFRIADADIARPVERGLEIAVIFEDFAAVARPHQHGHSLRMADQLAPAVEQRAAGVFNAPIAHVQPERLQADLQPDAPDGHILRIFKTKHGYFLPSAISASILRRLSRRGKGQNISVMGENKHTAARERLAHGARGL